MLEIKIKRGKAAAAVLSVVFTGVCIAYVFMPGGASRAAEAEELMQGGDTRRTVYTEITPGETLCINTADEKELQMLPGIGQTLAERIVAYRQDNGDFAQIEDIMKVQGIGTARFEAIRELISI